MAQVKITVVRGRTSLKDVAVSPGTPIGGSDALELNIDATAISKGDALVMIEAIRQKIYASTWPMV